jgi:hypothetical protein
MRLPTLSEPTRDKPARAAAAVVTAVIVVCVPNCLGTLAPSGNNAAPSSPSGCYPLTNKGTCYEPGERCRNSDHGASGVAGDGKSIICEDNDGWRWEPA